MPNDSFKKLNVEELKDLYSAENQLVRAEAFIGNA
jgi:ferritin-like metal-binding protein YciE